MRIARSRRTSFLVAAASSLTLLACGGGDSNGDADVTTQATSSVTLSSTTSASPRATPTFANTATPTPSPTPGASPTNPMPAALSQLDAVTSADCDAPDAADKPCITLTSNEETVRNGLATFGVATRAGGGHVALFGRNQSGEWIHWHDTQNTFLLLFLPGDVRICADGDGLNVRELPTISAKVITTVPDESVARVDQFVLDLPGEEGGRGFGWYHLTTPVEGWAHSDYLAAAAQGDCAVRDAQVTPQAPPATPPPVDD